MNFVNFSNSEIVGKKKKGGPASHRKITDFRYLNDTLSFYSRSVMQKLYKYGLSAQN